jgi:hypothetical protein
MTGFDFRPSRPIAITMTAVAALLLVFGLVTFVRQGFSWFAAAWLATAVLILGTFVRRFFVAERTDRRAADTGGPGRDGGLKPTRPMAVVSAVAGVGMAVFGVVKFGGSNPVFVVFWLLALVLIVGGQLWAAFSRPR